MLVTGDKHQRFKYFISQTTSIRFEVWSSRVLVISKLLTISSYRRLRCFQLCDGLWIVCNLELHCVAFYLK